MNRYDLNSVNDAREASRQGRYECRVLHRFRHHWQQRKSFVSWLDYVVFKRQLGYPLSAAHLRQALHWQRTPKLLCWHQGIYGHRARQLKNLIDEVQQHGAAPGVNKAYQQQVAKWRQHESEHRQQLLHQLQRAQVVVVGNSPNLAGKNLGNTIDQADIVVRFNQFASEQTRHCDIGSKLDVWVMAPGYRGPVPEQAEFVIVTGPNMLWWQQNWQTLQNHRGKIIGVPLNYWKTCVAELSAPPSAGFLIVQMLKQLPTERLAITGFGIKEGSPYHHAIEGHQAVSRHNWEAEGNLMKQWMQQHQL